MSDDNDSDQTREPRRNQIDTRDVIRWAELIGSEHGNVVMADYLGRCTTALRPAAR